MTMQFENRELEEFICKNFNKILVFICYRENGVDLIHLKNEKTGKIYIEECPDDELYIEHLRHRLLKYSLFEDISLNTNGNWIHTIVAIDNFELTKLIKKKVERVFGIKA